MPVSRVQVDDVRGRACFCRAIQFSCRSFAVFFIYKPNPNPSSSFPSTKPDTPLFPIHSNFLITRRLFYCLVYYILTYLHPLPLLLYLLSFDTLNCLCSQQIFTMASTSVNRPTNVAQKESDVNQKLQLYGIYSGFANGKVPSVSSSPPSRLSCFIL